MTTGTPAPAEAAPPAPAAPGPDGGPWPFVWVRYAALPVRDLDHPGGIADMWADPRVRDAVRLASPSLAHAIDRHLHDGSGDTTRLDRSLRRYRTRMAGRATPFGLLAGVFSARLTTGTTPGRRFDLRPAGHLRSEITTVRTYGLDPSDRIAAHRGLTETADGYLVPPRGTLRCPPSRYTYVAATPTMRRVVARLQQPVTTRTAVDRLTAESARPADEWRHYLNRLEELGILVRISRVTDRGWLTHTPLPPGDRPPATPDEAVSRDGTTDPRISIDAFAPADDGTPLPAEIGTQAALILDTLTRLNPPPGYPPHLAAMAAAFRRRFGPGAEVPVLDAFATGGIGGGLASPIEPTRPHRPDRDRILRALVAMDSPDPLLRTLDPALVEALSAASGGNEPPPPPAPMQELSVVPHLTPDGLRCELSFADPSAALGGRFLHLLPPHSHTEAIAQTAAGDRRFAPYEVVELLVTPVHRGRRLAAVVPVEVPRTRRMCLDPGADVSGTGVTDASDVLVGVDAATGRWYLRSVASGRRLHAVYSSMVLDDLLGPLEVFLLQVSRAQFRYALPFDWGGVSGLDFLPGLQVGQVRISPARWILRRALVTGPDPAGALRDHLARWWVPERYIARPAGSDRGLVLRRGADDDVLTGLLHRAPDGRVELRRGPHPHDEYPIRDTSGASHVTEIVVQVSPPAQPPPPDRTGVRLTLADLTRLNTAWTAVEVRMPAAAVPAFLARCLTGWLAARGTDATTERTWWETEPGDPPLVRICVPADTDDGRTADALWHWCRDLRRTGELSGAAQTEYHFHAARAATAGARAHLWEFFAADARRTRDVLAAHPPRSRAYAVAAAAHVYRLATAAPLDPAEIRPVLRDAEGDAGGLLYRRVGADLHTAVSGPPAPPWPQAPCRHLAGAATTADRLADLELSLGRLCAPDRLRPHLFGAARRLVDRDLHERRTRRDATAGNARP